MFPYSFISYHLSKFFLNWFTRLYTQYRNDMLSFCWIEFTTFFILHYLIIHSTYYTNSIPHEAYVSVEKGKKERMNMEISKLYN